MTKVRVNSDVMEVLQALFQECTERKHSGMCRRCTDKHAQNVHRGLLSPLYKEMTETMNMYKSDTTELEQLHKEAEVIREIKEKQNRQQNAIDMMEAKLISSVRATKEKNLRTYHQWNEMLQAKITNV